MVDTKAKGVAFLLFLCLTTFLVAVVDAAPSVSVPNSVRRRNPAPPAAAPEEAATAPAEAAATTSPPEPILPLMPPVAGTQWQLVTQELDFKYGFYNFQTPDLAVEPNATYLFVAATKRISLVTLVPTYPTIYFFHPLFAYPGPDGEFIQVDGPFEDIDPPVPELQRVFTVPDLPAAGLVCDVSIGLPTWGTSGNIQIYRQVPSVA